MRPDRIVLADDYSIIRRGTSPLLVTSKFDSLLTSKPANLKPERKCTFVGGWTSPPTPSCAGPECLSLLSHVLILLFGTTTPLLGSAYLR